MVNELPKDIVLYNKPVKCIHWNSTYKQSSSKGRTCAVTVECVNGETFEADHVIVTFPLGMFSGLQHSLLLFFVLCI